MLFELNNIICGEVVELVYGTSLENWRRFKAYRGFESHPLRQNKNKNGRWESKRSEPEFLDGQEPSKTKGKNVLRTFLRRGPVGKSHPLRHFYMEQYPSG